MDTAGSVLPFIGGASVSRLWHRHLPPNGNALFMSAFPGMLMPRHLRGFSNLLLIVQQESGHLLMEASPCGIPNCIGYRPSLSNSMMTGIQHRFLCHYGWLASLFSARSSLVLNKFKKLSTQGQLETLYQVRPFCKISCCDPSSHGWSPHCTLPKPCTGRRWNGCHGRMAGSFSETSTSIRRKFAVRLTQVGIADYERGYSIALPGQP